VAVHWFAFLVAQDLVSSLKEALKLLGIFAFYLILASMLTRPGDRRRLAWALVGGATAVSVIAIGQGAGASLGSGYGQWRAAGTMGHANTLGAYLAALMPVAWGLMWTELIRGRRRWIVALLAGMLLTMGLALGLTLSRASWLSLIVASMVVWVSLATGKTADAVLRRQRLTVAGVGLAVIAAAGLGLATWTSDTGSFLDSPIVERVVETVSLTSQADRERVVLLQAAWDMFLDHPLLGVGPGNYQWHIPEYTDYRPAWRHEFPHNVVLHIAAETGIIGLCAFLWWIGAVLSLGYNRMRNSLQFPMELEPGLMVGAFAGMVSVLVGSLFSYPFLHGVWEPLVYCLVLALIPPTTSPSPEEAVGRCTP